MNIFKTTMISIILLGAISFISGCQDKDSKSKYQHPSVRAGAYK